MPEKNTQKLDQEKVYQILSRGVIFTMEEDLKEAMQSQKLKTNLIPEQKKKEVGTNKAIFTEKAHFDPFVKIEETIKNDKPRLVLEPITKPAVQVASPVVPIIPTVSQKIGLESMDQLLQKRKEILEKIKNQKVTLEDFFQKIEIIKEQKNSIEKQEQEARDNLQKHSFEEQRWQVEEKFKQTQDLQWAKEEEIEKLQMALAKIDNDYNALEKKKIDFEKKQLENRKLLKNAELLRQKKEILSKGQDVLKKRPEVEAKYNEFLLEKNKIENDLLAIIQEEQKIEEQSKNIEKQIEGAIDAGERRKLEQERREVTQKRQIQEKKRWEAEKLQENIKSNIESVKENLLKLKQDEQAINQKVVEIEVQLSKDVVIVEKEKEIIEEKVVDIKPQIVEEKEKEIIKQIRLNAKEREQELIQKQFVQKQVIEEKQAMDEEQRQRIEEETRQKAIEKLKQIAEQEQKKLFTGKLKGPLLKEEILKKLTRVSPEEEAQRKVFLSKINQKTKQLPHQKSKNFEEGVVFHPMIKKISLFEKVTVRILIIFLIIGVIVGIYFLITKLTKKENANPLLLNNSTTTIVLDTISSTSSLPTTTTAPVIPITPPIAITTQTLLPPRPLISVSKNNIFSYKDSSQSIVSSIEKIIENKKQYNSFEQITIFDENQKSFLGAMQFFRILGAVLPEEINQENGTTTILVFSSKFGNRLGFILQTENGANIQSSFLSWENQAEADTASIFDLMGKTSPVLQKSFTDLKYKTTSIRCQAFINVDLGICYAIYKNYFIWTSSFEQMQRIVDKLP